MKTLLADHTLILTEGAIIEAATAQQLANRPVAIERVARTRPQPPT